MRRLLAWVVAAAVAGSCSLASAQIFSENFDSYATGAALHGTGGWKGWSNASSAGAPTSSKYAYSGKNSVEVIGTADLVHPFALSSGVLQFTAMQYIPKGTTGTSDFILLNQYSDAGSANDWSVQLEFDLGSGVVTANAEGDGVKADIIYGRWVELKFIIDLDNNTCEWYYGGELITTHPWDDNTHGTLQAIDLFGNSADSVYYDDIVVQYSRLAPRNPNPADGAMGVTSGLLQWSRGPTAASYNVYLGSSPELTETSLLMTKMKVTNLLAYYSGALQAGVTYYWRVDAVASDGTVHTGDVWSFTVKSLTAYAPIPSDGHEGIEQATTLSWQAAKTAKKHHVYFGDDSDAVLAGDAAVDQGTISETSFSTPLLRSGTTYYWRVDEIDASDGVQVGDVWSFATFHPVQDKIVYEWWTNVTGTSVAALTSDSRFPNDPTGRKVVDLFEGPIDWKEYYGSRFYGWLTPEKTGAYTFWIASDDMSQLWLSTDADPANAVEIAKVTGSTTSRDFDSTTSQKSAAITLTAGRKYYIKALMKEHGGGDNIAVAWQPPNGAREVIDAKFVDTYALLPVAAATPSPENKAVDTAQSLELSWFAGEKAVQHDVYFGDDAAAVAAADTTSALYQGRQSGTTFEAADLDWGKTYYWRVDEIDTGDADSPWKGAVWSFTTADFLSVEDIESYDDDDNRLYDTWIDGLTNNTGSYVGYENSANGTFGETTIVHGGGQSMPMSYDNTKSPYYSEISRTWTTAQNWTVNGVTTLTLYVRGKTAGDLGVLYVALEDNAGKSAVVSYPDDTSVVSGAWIEWRIPLSSFTGVKSAKIQTMRIGVGSRTNPVQGGAGVIYIDDIRVAK
ncbi:MAG TPA: PA14 domain-containing protein [Sedimentisphaerales bacterium]|jgi:hypothetical protein|nr:PA14 domain-containing protein [Sedimentisphaerales bacterium]HNU29564.1 PA14 domain-containing protein [Sedimentisphaerales bacterium]